METDYKVKRENSQKDLQDKVAEQSQAALNLKKKEEAEAARLQQEVVAHENLRKEFSLLNDSLTKLEQEKSSGSVAHSQKDSQIK